MYSYESRLHVEQADTGKERKRLLMLLKKYTDYKKGFARQIRFNSSQPNLSEYVFSQNLKLKFIPAQPPP